MAGFVILIADLAMAWPWDWCIPKGSYCSGQTGCCEGTYCNVMTTGIGGNFGLCCNDNDAFDCSPE